MSVIAADSYFSIKFENDRFIFLDQTKLPLQEVYVETDDYNRIAEAIERLEVRGAPAIGISAAYALALSLKDISSDKSVERFYSAYKRLEKTRPTAVNLFYALTEIKKVFESNTESQSLYQTILTRAKEIHQNDITFCDKIGENGSKLFLKKSSVLTHCNTGKLATGGDGTAFNVIKKAFKLGLVNFVYADETRPLLQGSRLTAFELEKNGIPFAIQTDSMAAVLMQQNKVDLVITGADRIALNGDTANKIGTYNLAVLCNYHNVPFYIAAPTTTIDRTIPTGSDIKIEYRNKNEITNFNGHQVTPPNYEAFSPAFDVTPSHLISGIITEETIYFFPYNFL
ncbi:MAG TPA: S-methyl-5-thioribose-1-phosphate isomerase [Ignavibacteriaceae bacterium]|nr:S-methyl-5-thioribose-1-phosphate isomerase [Ignavibacteriaceae bacterium]